MLLRSATGWFMAVSNGTADMVQASLDKFVRQVNASGSAGLHIAIAKGHKDIVKLLAPYEGAIRNAHGETPFHLALKEEDTYYIDTLLALFPRNQLESPLAEELVGVAQQTGNRALLYKIEAYMLARSREPVKMIESGVEKAAARSPAMEMAASTAATVPSLTTSAAGKATSADSQIYVPDTMHRSASQSAFEPPSESVKTPVTKSYSETRNMYPALSTDASPSIDLLAEGKASTAIGCQTDERLFSANDVAQVMQARDDRISALEQRIRELEKAEETIDKLQKQNDALKEDRADFSQKLRAQFEEGKQLANNVINRLFTRVPREVDDGGNTLLMYAAMHGYPYLIYRLISENAETGMTNKAGHTALMIAAMTGNAECVKLLAAVEGGITTAKGVTALHLAAKEGRLEAVRILLPYETNISSHSGTTALHMACKRGFTEIVELLAPIQSGCVQTDGISGLMVASAEGYADIVRILVEKEARLKDLTGKTALMYAAERGNGQAVSILLTYESGLKDANGHTALMMASKASASFAAQDASPGQSKSNSHRDETQMESLVTLLMSNSAEVGKVDNYGWSALMFAARDNNVPMVRLLLAQEKGIQAYDGQTALMIASQANAFSAAHVLADVEAKMQDNAGKTALITAAAKGHTKLVMYLLEYEAGIQDSEGKTALMFAARNGHLQAVTLLLEKEARMKDTQGTTALMYAAAAGHMAVVQALVEREGGLRDSDGKSAANYAAVCGHRAISEFLML